MFAIRRTKLFCANEHNKVISSQESKFLRFHNDAQVHKIKVYSYVGVISAVFIHALPIYLSSPSSACMHYDTNIPVLFL